MEPERQRRRYRSIKFWAFTKFIDEEEFEGLLPFDEWVGVNYLVYQLEQCPDTGRLHFQGYLETARTVRLGFVRRLNGLEGAHFEHANGSPEQNKAYCTKQESRLDGPWEHGVISRGFEIPRLRRIPPPLLRINVDLNYLADLNTWLISRGDEE